MIIVNRLSFFVFHQQYFQTHSILGPQDLLIPSPDQFFIAGQLTPQPIDITKS